MADLKECKNCGVHFSTEYARREHICESKESDDKILAFLRKEGKKDGRDSSTHN